VQRKWGRKRGRFARFLLIYAASFLFLIAVGLFIFWKYIASYEISRPENTMDALLASQSADEWASLWEDGLVVSDFEDKDTISTSFSAATFRIPAIPTGSRRANIPRIIRLHSPFGHDRPVQGQSDAKGA
jgi:hypothetical protein